MKMLLIITFALLTACGTKVIYVSTPLPCPIPMKLPELTPEIRAEIGKLDANSYTYIFRVKHDQIKRRATLQAICRSTHE